LKELRKVIEAEDFPFAELGDYPSVFLGLITRFLTKNTSVEQVMEERRRKGVSSSRSLEEMARLMGGIERFRRETEVYDILQSQRAQAKSSARTRAAFRSTGQFWVIPTFAYIGHGQHRASKAAI
jgi:hypothetical protein